MAQEFDVVVIGTGAAGSSVAHVCAKAGRKVAVIDRRPFGGTCALRGCDPKKVLIGAEEVVHRRNDLQPTGALDGTVTIDWLALIRFKNTFTEPVPEGREAFFREAGIATYHGTARFSDPSTIAINGELLRTQSVVVATGAHPARLGIRGEEHLTTSDEFLNLEDLPSRIIFLGGGYISFEFAHIVARAGAKASILHRGERPLEGFDGDLVAQLIRATQDAGIDVHLRTTVTGIERDDDSYHVWCSDGAHFSADLVVHGAGRVPEIEDLDLENGTVAHSRNGVVVNEFLQSTTNPRVYAAGDAADAGRHRLSPVAGLTGEIVADNILKGNKRAAHLDVIPTLVYTNPALAAVGARESDVDTATADINAGDMSEWYSYRRTGERFAAYKLIVHKTEDRVLGAHILGAGAEELINLFTLAIRYRVPVSQLRDTIFGYPTYSSDAVYMV